MPIEHQIDHERRRVLARGRGTLTDLDLFLYQCDVWSLPEVDGYDELVDLTGVERVAPEAVERLRELAHLAAAMDPVSPGSRCAIVAPEDYLFGLGRMFETYRRLEKRTTKEIVVFRSLADALLFLQSGIDPRTRV